MKRMRMFVLSAVLVLGCSEKKVFDGEGDVSTGIPSDTGPSGTSIDVGSGTGSGTGGDPDTGGTDTGVPRAGEFGAPCNDNSDCDSQFCIESFQGFVCTQTCFEDCPAEWSCKAVLNTLPDVVFVCVPDVNVLCEPCIADQQCSGGKCVALGPDEDEGTFCVAQCEEDEDCPSGFECGVLGGPTGADLRACLPQSGTCTCTTANEGDVRSCKRTNEWGACTGFQACDPKEGWSQCSGLTPIPEQCDGADNDCDGLIDEDVGDGEACANDSEFGTCSGILTCLGQLGPVCSASIPEPEVCDYKDNDCDGQTDEEFKAGDSYDHPEHCGSCGVDCEKSIANAKGSCDPVTWNPPQCVVEKCEPGFYEVNEFLCNPIPGQLCDSCIDDESCVAPGAKCVELSDGPACTVACAAGEGCPKGYSCSDIDGDLVCTPDTDTCGCDGSNTELQQSCEVTWQAAGQPIVTCGGVQQCTSDGWTECILPQDVCDGVDNDCDGDLDGPWVNESGLYDTDAHCGVCNNNCEAAPWANATGECSTEQGLPQCVVDCDEGFFDVNQNPNDGCECWFDSATDHPDGFDHNCDGVDGEIENAVFVAKTGDDANPGTIDAPVLTAQAGIVKAQTQGKRDVYVATGVYAENVTLAAAVAVYGGYSGDFFDRDITLYETAILGGPPKAGKLGAVNASGLNGDAALATKLVGFTVFGYANQLAGGSSYAVWLLNCGDQLEISSNVIVAGAAGNGTPGTQGFSGATGVGGGDGLQAFDLGQTSCGAKNNNAGGASGTRTCAAVVVDGGAGGTAICPDYDEDSAAPSCPGSPYLQSATVAETGAPGLGPGGGQGGVPGNDAYIDAVFGPYTQAKYDCATVNGSNCTSCLLPPNQKKEGEPGQPGTQGADGPAGAGCAVIAGSVVNDQWQSGPGGAGGDAQPGGGGGGGGAAGGVETNGCAAFMAEYDDIGASGGGGGSGGCGGTGGKSGTGGGGSFGIFTSWSAPPASLPTIASNAISRGTGGVGGNGGPGGTGGAGGAAGNGGESGQESDPTFCTTTAGKGGAGGHGGHGAGGGGGCGGVSFGIFVSGANGPAIWEATNAFQAGGSPGAGGLGGASLGQPGGDGLQGAGGDTNF